MVKILCRIESYVHEECDVILSRLGEKKWGCPKCGVVFLIQTTFAVLDERRV